MEQQDAEVTVYIPENESPAAHRAGSDVADSAKYLRFEKTPDPGQAERTQEEPSWMDRMKDHLNAKIWRCKVWMVIPVVLLLIVAVIFISLALCTWMHKDEDENYDKSLFIVPQNFNGSFQITSNHSSGNQVLGYFEDKLNTVYKSSPALGRYFIRAEALLSSEGSATVLYQLMFKLPEENLEELRNFTVSLEVVKNVFRQFLSDQGSGDMSVTPTSLKMSLMRR
nr:TPA-induced transmembrane protein isoform X1 [Nothobranchius furzeri]